MTTSGDTGAVTAVESSKGVFAAAAKMRAHEWPGGVQVLVVVGGDDSELVRRAAASGIAHLLVDAETLEEALRLALKQAEQFDRLRAVTARLAQVERAKGVLMERHKLSERDAHERLRSHARKLNLKLSAVAEAVENSYLLLPLEEPEP